MLKKDKLNTSKTKTEKHSVNLLDETIFNDEGFKVIRNYKDTDIKVEAIKSPDVYKDNTIINLNEEILKENQSKKKPQVFKYAMFGILIILAMILIIIIAIKLA